MSGMSAREFSSKVAKAKRLSDSGPVIITDRGRPSHGEDIEFDPPAMEDSGFRPLGIE